MTGSIVLTTNQGLGVLAKSFYDNGIIDRVMVKHHSSRENHYEWYPDRCNEEQLLECDTLLFFETPFDHSLVKKAKAKGIRTVMIMMYECSTHLEMYDLVLAPSLLDLKNYKNSIFFPIPVDVPWKLRKKAKVFVHNAGNGGLGGRNGTKELVEAWKHVASDAKLIIRSQVPMDIPNDPRITVEIGTIPESELYSEGDVFIFPEKFNGLSLPLQEAYASGMCVMATDRFPMNTWLPSNPLIPVEGYKKERIAIEFDSAIINPIDIALKVDEYYGKDISNLSRKGKEWAEENSWKKLKQKYLELLQ